MVADELGITVGHAGQRLIQCVVKGRLWRCSAGMYTSIDRRPPWRVDEDNITVSGNVTYSPRGPDDFVTDDMLKRFGYNL